MKQCKVCGSLSYDDTLFCYVCGTRFTDSDESVAEEHEIDDLAPDTEASENNKSEEMAKQVIDSLLRFDGLYQCGYQSYSSYLRFFSSGVVVEVGSTGTPEQVIKWLSQNNDNRGTYTISNGRIDFELYSSAGKVSYSGSILNDTLLQLDIHSYINGYTANNLQYHFCECSA